MLAEYYSGHHHYTWQLSIPLFLGLLIATAIFIYLIPDNKTDFEQYALQNDTVSVFSRINGIHVHCNCVEDKEPCINGYLNNAINNNLFLYLGNSQLHAINQYKDGDESAPLILHGKMNQSSSGYLVTYSQPDANLHEHYLLFEYLQFKMPIKSLILPIVYDDMRETGVRHNFAKIIDDKKTRSQLSLTDIG